MWAVSTREVAKLVEAWRPRSCENEKDFERSLFRYLEKALDKADIIKQYAAGRVKGDIVVDDATLIEIKDRVDSTGKLQRLIGQLEIYQTKWKGKVIVVVCGDSQRDLVKILRTKIQALNNQPLFDLFWEPKFYLIEK